MKSFWQSDISAIRISRSFIHTKDILEVAYQLDTLIQESNLISVMKCVLCSRLHVVYIGFLCSYRIVQITRAKLRSLNEKRNIEWKNSQKLRFSSTWEVARNILLKIVRDSEGIEVTMPGKCDNMSLNAVIWLSKCPQATFLTCCTNFLTSMMEGKIYCWL